jgi:ketosteroid isomerase-like protein
MVDRKGLRCGGGLLFGGLLAVHMLVAAAPAVAQERAAGRIPTVTRLVRIMLTQEEQLTAAVQGHDEAALARLLADDFEMRVGTAPGTPVPRDEWIKSALARPGHTREIEQMSAHEFGDIVLASYLERPAGTAASPTAAQGPSYVNDVWKRTGDNWKLVRRFIAPAGVKDFAPLGSGGQSPVLPKRY